MYEYVGDPSYHIERSGMWHCAEENSQSPTWRNVQDVYGHNSLIIGH